MIFAAVVIGLVAWTALVIAVVALCRAAARAERAHELETADAPSLDPPLSTADAPRRRAVAHR